MFQVYDSNTNNVIENIDSTVFKNKLKKRWDDLHQQTDIFRYQINVLNEKIVSDLYLVQLNTNRGIKRRMPENINNISQAFDDEKFNFTKVSSREMIFTLVKNNADSNKHAILVNVSPINRYHCLLCPSIYQKLPQVITLDSLKLTLEIMLYIKDRSLKIGFNSLCALASVNHLHYHLLFESRPLPVELAKTKPIKGSLSVLEEYVVPTFCFDVNQNVEIIAEDIFNILQYMLKQCIAHNILISWIKCGDDRNADKMRVFVWPRKSCAGVKNLAAFNVAVCELSGWFPVYDAEEFANIQREDLESELRKWKYEEFSQLCDEVKSLL